MGPNRNPRAPGVAPGEPEAPVAAPQAAPAPPAPNRTTDDRAHEDDPRVQKTRHGHAVPKNESNHPRQADRAQPHQADRAQPHQADRAQPHQADRGQPQQADHTQTPQDQGAPATEGDGAPAPQGEGVSAPELDEVAAKAEKAEQYLELAQRTKADFENYRKRAARETAAAQERGVAKLTRELLPAVDNLDRALAHVEGDADNGAAGLISAIKLVHADVVAALARVGIDRFSPEGERFDPQRHEAIAQQPVDGAEPGTIVEVYQRGYALGDFVIRPARVVVAG